MVSKPLQILNSIKGSSKSGVYAALLTHVSAKQKAKRGGLTQFVPKTLPKLRKVESLNLEA